MLRPADNFHVAPVGIVGEDEGFAEQCALQPLPGAPVEPVDRQAVFDFDRHLEQLVTGLEPAGDPGSLRGRRLAVAGAPGAPTPQPVLELPLSPLFPQQGCAVKSFSCDRHGALDQGARGAPGADAVEAADAACRRACRSGCWASEPMKWYGLSATALSFELLPLSKTRVFGAAVACDERVGQAGWGMVSRVVQQRQAEVGGDEESEADERLAALLAVAGQRAALVWKVKKLVARTRPRSTSRTMRVTRSIPGMASRGTRLFQNRWLVS